MDIAIIGAGFAGLSTAKVLRTVGSMDDPGLAPLSVALRTLRGLVRQGAAGD